MCTRRRAATRGFGTLLALSIGMPVAASEAPSYDFSTPERALASLQKAFTRRDAAAIADGTYFPGSEGISSQQEKEELIGRWPETKGQWFGGVELLLSRLAIRQVDQVVPYNVRKSPVKALAPFGEAARVMCTLRLTPELESMYPAGREHVVAMYFVRRQGRWQWYSDPYLWLDNWSYDCSSPEQACESVILAIRRHDVTGVSRMIDARMLVGTDMTRFKQVARQRLEAIAEWQAAERAAREEARRERAPVPKPTPRPFVARDPHWGTGKLQVELFKEEGIELARVWRGDSSGARGGYETFVKQADQWRWRPKKEYTVWVIGHAESGERR